MNKILKYILILLITCFSCSSTKQLTKSSDKEYHVVFIVGDEEYRSEESMPMMARILKRELGAKISMCYTVDDKGNIDPNRLDHVDGLEALATADLMVMFTRFRALPDNELKMITDYVDSGKPVVGFRTSTHAFLYENDPSKESMNNKWPTEVFGQQWITHHGHFDDGANPLTSIEIIPEKFGQPILHGVEPFKAYSWLYHVDGGDWKLHGDSEPILRGISLKSGHEMKGRLDKFPLVNPVAWTKTYKGARVFFTTLGHPFDFKHPSMRSLSLNGIYWALGLEEQIPWEGFNVDVEGYYLPNNSGFGQKFKKGLTKADI